MSYLFPVVPRLHPPRILHSPSLSHPSPLPPHLFPAALPWVSAPQTCPTPLSPHPCLSLLLQPSKAASAPSRTWCCPSFPSAADLSPCWPLGCLITDQNLSWARQLRSSESLGRHLMIKYLIKDYMIPKSKREPHTAYLI